MPKAGAQFGASCGHKPPKIEPHLRFSIGDRFDSDQILRRVNHGRG